MVYVVLRNGKVIKYNSGQQIAVEDGCITVRGPSNGKPNSYLVARIPLEIVERAEFEKPCAILKAKSAPHRKADY